jgi:TonB-dependent starch-binding outer membrane protein SusC
MICRVVLLALGVPAHLVAAPPLLMRAPTADLFQQQSAMIIGQVLDARTRAPLRSAEVRIPGTSIRSVTDINGRYRLNGMPTGAVTVRVRLIGYATGSGSAMARSGQSVELNFALEQQAVQLSEVVVTVDATTVGKVELGTDIERIRVADVLAAAAVPTMSNLINARAAGLDVQAATGPVGSASRIRVRGATSITRANNPIIIIDGIRVSNQTDQGPESVDWTEGRTVSRLDDINPNDVASVQVMKGPTAAALYGSDAASGVIILQTRRGATGQHRVTLNTEVGLIRDVSDWWDNYFNLTRSLSITDVNDPVARQWSAVKNPVTGQVWAIHNPMTNPLTRPLRTGHYTNTSLDLSGGRGEITYYVSGKYEDGLGVTANNTLTRYSMRANVEVRPAETLTLTASSSFLASDTRLPESSRSFRGLSTNAGAGFPLLSFGLRPDGSRGDCLATLVRQQDPRVCEERQGNLTYNFDKLMTVRSDHRVGRFIGSLLASWVPRPWLTNRFVVGLDYIQSRNRNLFPLDPDRPFGTLSLGYIRDDRHTDQFRTYEYTGTVSAKVTDELSSTTTVGAQYFSKSSELVGCIGQNGFASPTANACDAALTTIGFSNLVSNVEAGVYLQQRLGYKGYLFGTVGIRRDDNSAFGQNQGAIWSPGANLSVALSEMPFWKWEKINSLRVRFAWGNAAQAPPPQAAIRRYKPVRLEVGGVQRTGVSPAFPGNPDLTAERKREIEAGIDLGALDDVIAVKFTYYHQKVTDAILERFIAPSIGFRGQQWVNIGAIENTGVEAQITAQVLRGQNVSWDLDFKLAMQDPIVTSLGDEAPLLLGANRGMFRVGYAPGSYYGPVVQGAVRDAQGNIVPGTAVIKPGDIGDPRNPTHSYLGQPQARNQQSLSSGVGLFGGKIRISTLFERKGDVQKYNGTGAFRSPWVLDESVDRKWAFRQVELTPDQQAALERSVATGDANFRNWVFVEDGSFIKWRELTASFDLPRLLFSGVSSSLQSVRITFGARNLHTWTKYSGLDPESVVIGGREWVGNEEFYGEPQPRFYFTRLSVAF